MSKTEPVHVVGAGLAGSEAAWQLAQAGCPVVLHEMRPERMTPAHQTGGFAELVCSNSFRSDDWEFNAVGLLHAEMRRCDSLIMACGDAAQVPAGGALAVDRDQFSEAVTARLRAHPNVTVVPGEVAGLPPADWASVIVSTGPLTSPALSQAETVIPVVGLGYVATRAYSTNVGPRKFSARPTRPAVHWELFAGKFLSAA